MSEFTVAAISTLASAIFTGIFAFCNAFFTSRENRKMKLIELGYRDAAAAFSEYLAVSSVVPKPINTAYIAGLSKKFECASLYASKRTRPVLEKHFLATIRSPESLEPDEAAHALKLKNLRDELLKSMQNDLSGRGKSKCKDYE